MFDEGLTFKGKVTLNNERHHFRLVDSEVAVFGEGKRQEKKMQEGLESREKMWDSFQKKEANGQMYISDN